MKKLKYLLSIYFLAFNFSCNNESLESNNSFETNPALIIEKINLFREVSNGNSTSIQNYNELGMPTEYIYLNNLDFTREYNYDDNKYLISLYEGPFPFSGIFFSYQANQLIEYSLGNDTGSGVRVVNYNDNVVESIPPSPNQDYKTVYTFSDNKLQLLIKIEHYGTIPNSIDLQPVRFHDFIYDDNLNVIKETITRYSDFTESFLTSTNEQVFDNKHNPFLNTTHIDPIALIISYDFDNENSTGSIIEPLSRLSPNNVLSLVRTSEFGNVRSFDFEYEYNEFDYPISAIRTKFGGTFSETINYTYNYYEN